MYPSEGGIRSYLYQGETSFILHRNSIAPGIHDEL